MTAISRRTFPAAAVAILVTAVVLLFDARELSYRPSWPWPSGLAPTAMAMDDAPIAIPGRVSRFVYDGDTHLYAIDNMANELHAVDVTSRSIIRSVAVGAQPTSVRLVNGGADVFVLSAASRSVFVFDAATLSPLDVIDLAPWIESVPEEPDALMVNDNASRVLVNTRLPFLLDNGSRHNFFGSILTIDTVTRSVIGVLPTQGTPVGSYELATYGGNLVNGIEGALIYYKGAESGVLYSTEIGSGKLLSGTLIPRPECARVDSARGSVLVYSEQFVVSLPIAQSTRGASIGGLATSSIDLRFHQSNDWHSEFCRWAIDEEMSAAYLLDSRRSRLVTIDLVGFQVLDLKPLIPQPTDLAILSRQDLVAVAFPDAGEIRLYPRYRR